MPGSIAMTSLVTRRFVGVDVSARRGLDVAVLDDGGRVLRVEWLATATASAALLALAREQGDCVVAIDAPQAPRRANRLRECDRDLRSRGIALYQVPRPDEPLAPRQDWLRLGFDLFAELLGHDWRLPVGPADASATLLEIYPYASFATLLGRLPTLKTTPTGREQRRAVLTGCGLTDLPADASHDILDALAAALTALRYARGAGCLVGDPRDGYMALPVPAECLERWYEQPSP